MPPDSEQLKTLDHELNQTILKGDLLGAFEKYYDESIEMQENADAPRKGKAANRTFEKNFIDSVAQVHAIKLLGSAVGDGLSYSEWMFDLSFKNGTRATSHQVSARRWANGKVIRERFYYNKH